jgi:hypothetical protein
MFNRKTVFIVGAGASFEAKIPCGTELADIISTKLDIRFGEGRKPIGRGDLTLYALFYRAYRNEIQQYLQAAWTIRDGIPLSNSIDDFLALWQHDPRVTLYGKAAIAKCVLEAERASKFWFDPYQTQRTIDFTANSTTWFVRFMRMLSRDVLHGNVKSILKNVAFIVFNYDRCLEHFLFNAIQSQYRLPAANAAEIVRSALIIHPYGTVGDICFPGEHQGTHFGGSDDVNYIDVGQNIKTYTESVPVDSVHEALRDAKCMIFLGFGFHAQNMKVLGNEYKEAPVFATSFGMSGDDTEACREQISAMFQPLATGSIYPVLEQRPIEIKPLTCADLFTNWSKSLAG